MSEDNAFVLTHASGLHAVARKLDALHQETLRAESRNGNQQLVRLFVLNLIAACTSIEDADLATHTVGLLSQTHPTRAVVIHADPGQPVGIEADLSLQRAASASGDVNAEQVRLNVYGPPAYHLASVVTPLLVPDIPVYLWLVGAPPLRQAFGQDAIAICERIIIDSGEYGDARATLATMASEFETTEGTAGLADLAWVRGQIWRELIAQAFDGEQMLPFVDLITRVEVESCGTSPSAQAWLCAGWLSDRLGWNFAGGPYVVAAAAEVDGVPEHELSAVRVTCVGNGHQATVTVERREETLYTTIHVDGGITTSRVIALRQPSIAELVAGLLAEQSSDPLYPSALRRAAALAGR